MSIQIFEYNLKTKKFKHRVVDEIITDSDRLIAAEMGIKYFDTREEMIQFHQMHQDLTSTQNNINTNKEIEVKSEMKLDISDDDSTVIDGPEISIHMTEIITPLAKSWGGKRAGSGSKKGQPKSQQTKEKMRLAKLGNKNATKSK
jgi:hypothetical protein